MGKADTEKHSLNNRQIWNGQEEVDPGQLLPLPSFFPAAGDATEPSTNLKEKGQ